MRKLLCKNAYYVVKAVVYYSISVREKAGLAFYETPTTEFRRLSTKLSSSSKVDRFLAGASISQRTHKIVCLVYRAGISWNGGAFWHTSKRKTGPLTDLRKTYWNLCKIFKISIINFNFNFYTYRHFTDLIKSLNFNRFWPRYLWNVCKISNFLEIL